MPLLLILESLLTDFPKSSGLRRSEDSAARVPQVYHNNCPTGANREQAIEIQAEGEDFSKRQSDT